MEWFWILVAAGGSGYAARWWRARRGRQRASREALDGVRRLAEEDLHHLGSLLARLDPEVRQHGSSEDVREAHTAAVAAHASARETASQVTAAEDVSRVTAAVARGRNALAVLEARVAGEPDPEDRLMCFFDPQHGPSSVDVVWSRPGYGERRVPACARDAGRVAEERRPEIRSVTVGARTSPYWTAGDAFRPYTSGYFASAPTLAWACEPEVADAAVGPPTRGHIGSGIVGSSGHFDGGGFDGSGAPS